jgi:diguanylate cyclase (GGDEF)-like protein
MKNRTAWIGAAVALWGVAALAGFTFHIRWLTQLEPSRDASMTVSGAISLVLAAAALLWIQRTQMSWRRPVLWGPRLLTAALLALNAIALAENLMDVNLGVDWPSLHYWMADPALRVGRMAPNASLGFLFLGAGYLLVPNLHSRRRAAALDWLLGLVVVAGASGVVGYVIHIEELYTYHGIPAMPLYTALALLALAAGLWLLAREQGSAHSRARAAGGGRILSTAALVLIVVVLVAGASGLGVLWQVENQNAFSNLSLRRDERINYIAALLASRQGRGQLFVQQLAAQQLSATAPLQLPSPDFTAVWVENAHGAVTASAGRRVNPAMALPLTPNLALLWRDGFYLRQSLPQATVTAPAPPGSQADHTVVVEQPLPLLVPIGMETSIWGTSGEVGLCGPDPADAQAIACFPSRLRPAPYIASRYVYRDLVRPIVLALEGRSGVTVAPDFHNHRAMMAYGPIPGVPLALVAKIDTTETYASIRLQLELMVPLLAALTLVGLATLRRQVRPMVGALVESRNEAIYSEARFRAAAESSMDAFFIFECARDPERSSIIDFQLSFANSHGEAFAGLAAGARGRSLSEFPRLSASAGFFEKYKRVVKTRVPLLEEFAVPPGDSTASTNSPTWLYQQVVPLGDGVAVTVRDITERKRNEEHLTRLAQHDALTGLPNRRAFLSRLAHAMETAQRLRHQALLAVLYLDLDHLKVINDRFGHHQGDQLLRSFGARLRESVRTADTVARMGGDEFTVLLENLQGPVDAERVITTIFAALAAGAQLDGQQVPISASIGAAFYNGEPIGAETLLQQADIALYQAKRAGRNCFQVYAPPPA